MLVLRDPAHTVTVVKGADGAGIATITLTHCTLTAPEHVFVAIAEGRTSAMQSWHNGALKVSGDMAVAQRFGPHMFDTAKLEAASGVSASPAAGGGEGYESEEIYGMFKAAIAAQGPKLVEKVKGVIVYVITAGPNNKKWTFYTDLKNGEGKVGQGRVKKPDLTVTMKDKDFLAIAQGKMKPQMAFMRGKLKIKGSMGLAMKLQGVIDIARKEFGPKL